MVPPRAEKSSLKRGRQSTGEDQDIKKPRRSQRISSQAHPTPADTPLKDQYLPSPVTHADSSATESYQRGTATPEDNKPGHVRHETPESSSPRLNSLSSPPQDTQPMSQFIYPPPDLGSELDDEDGTWGYLFPLNHEFGHRLIMKRRSFCPAPIKPLEINRKHVDGRSIKDRDELIKAEEAYEKDKEVDGFPAGGYLIGRHPECDLRLDINTISNRHCLIFSETRNGGSVAILEDLSSNGTYINDAIVGRNKRRELEDGDEIVILDEVRFLFRYPRNRDSSAFQSKYRILQRLGRGHFATVYLCVDRASGSKFAVKKFERRSGESQKSQTEGLQQEIGVLMSVSHPNVLCLKDIFDESDGVYLVLELAAEGELFNLIVSRQKLTEDEARKVFIQLFQGIKYLHERNIVHRDIKPENILLTDKSLSVKIADFGLAKIIGEESFTTTLCGTPSYVAPEILQNTKHRRYTRGVDIWSLGVVLYICLCGFPPFSDELYTRENPYTLAQQIKMGRFDYPSPYWDSIADPALDLIDRMLTVDFEKRITIDECLSHPWTLNLAGDDASGSLQSTYINPEDSTNGLTGAMNEVQLSFADRKVKRERTLLASINDVKLVKTINVDRASLHGQPQRHSSPAHVKVWDKNPQGKKINISSQEHKSLLHGKGNKAKEEHPANNRTEGEFMQMGGQGDMQLFSEDASSRYTKEEVPES